MGDRNTSGPAEGSGDHQLNSRVVNKSLERREREYKSAEANRLSALRHQANFHACMHTRIYPAFSALPQALHP